MVTHHGNLSSQKCVVRGPEAPGQAGLGHMTLEKGNWYQPLGSSFVFSPYEK